MIVNIRGTSGSGKSTLVRRVFDLYEKRISLWEEGRKQPIGYTLHRHVGRPLFVPGHYEGDCGGCDTISGQDKIIALVRKWHEDGYDVLFEGLLMSGEVRRNVELHQAGLPYTCIAIDLPLDQCLAAVVGRREAKASRLGKPPPEPLNPKATVEKWKGTKQAAARLQAGGCLVHTLTRDDALAKLRELLAL